MRKGGPSIWDSGRVESLDLLRLAAAILIVLYHYTFHGPGAYHLTWVAWPAVTPVTKYFFLGVPLFFVISGFVIAYSAQNRSVLEFFIARFSRIYPGFVLCMSLTFASIAAFGAPSLQTSVAQWAANLFVAAPAFRQPYMDMVYWSIVCEIVFYVLVAGTIALKLFDRRLPFLIAGWLALSMANEFFLNSEVLRRIFITNYSGTFASGMLLYLHSRGERGAWNTCLLFAAVSLGGVQAGWSADWLRERGVDISSAVAIAGGALAPVIVGFCMFFKRLPWRSSITLALGGMTYPLYLIHQFFGYVLFNKLEGVAAAEFVIPAMVAFMLVLSFVLYRYLERPAQSWTRQALKAMVQAKLAWRVGSAGAQPTETSVR